jgi:hypothetical protein
MATEIKPAAESMDDALMAMLQPIARILIKRGFGAGELIQAAKLAYIQAAIREVVPRGHKINISRLSVATGLTRKEISALLHSADNDKPMPSTRRNLQQRALRVLHGWSVDPIFQRADGRPADLPLQGEPHSFALLVKRHGADVTPVSVLHELERMKVVTITPSGKIKFDRRTLTSTAHATRQMVEFSRLFKDFANTVQQICEPKNPPLFFGFKDLSVSSSHQIALFQRTFSKRASSLLESVDQWVAHQTKEKKGKTPGVMSKTRVGLGVYLVQEGD